LRKEKCDASFSKFYRQEREDNDAACSIFKKYIDDETFEENKKRHFRFNVVAAIICFVVMLIATGNVLIAVITTLVGYIGAWLKGFFRDWDW